LVLINSLLFALKKIKGRKGKNKKEKEAGNDAEIEEDERIEGMEEGHYGGEGENNGI